MIPRISFLLLLLIPATVAHLHKIRLNRRPVSVTRAFSHSHRPWAPPISNPFPIHRFREETSRFPEHPLYGNIVKLGEYYVTLHFGGQPINVQVDTGSSTTAVPLKQCHNCRANDHRLDLDTAAGTADYISCESPACRPNFCGALTGCSVCSPRTRACCSSEAPKACGFFLRYADQSGASGALVQADVTMAGLTVPLAFGAILKETSKFENDNVDGILGMAFKSLACNPTCVLPLFDTLVNEGKVKKDIFSICTDYDGGVVTLGGSDPNLYVGNLKYVPLAHSSTKHFYGVDVKGIGIGGKKVNIPSFSRAIVDSGTTVMVLAPMAYNAIKAYFQTHYCNVPGLCPGSSRAVDRMRVVAKADLDINLTEKNLNETLRAKDASWFSPGYCARLEDSHIKMLPDITISLNGIDLVLDADTYMLKYEERSTLPWDSITYRCIGISSLQGLNSMENNAILGNTVLIKYFVEYDRENDRLGFAVGRNCVDKARQSNPGQTEIEGQQRQGLPPWLMWILTVGCIMAWIVLIAICVREARRPAGYTSIPGNS